MLASAGVDIGAVQGSLQPPVCVSSAAAVKASSSSQTALFALCGLVRFDSSNVPAKCPPVDRLWEFTQQLRCLSASPRQLALLGAALPASAVEQLQANSLTSPVLLYGGASGLSLVLLKGRLAIALFHPSVDRDARFSLAAKSFADALAKEVFAK